MELGDYLRELRNIRLPDREEEAELWRRFKDMGDEDARRKLIEVYQPLVFREATAYSSRADVMDIVQEGTVGLIEAAERYDYRLGTVFSLYAVHRIRGRMLNFLAKETKAPSPCIDEDTGLTVAEVVADTSPSVAEIAESQELALKLHEALDRLPQKERLVLESLYLKCEEVRTVAEEMDVSASHIYRLQKKGIRRVRGMLARFMHGWR